MKTFAFFRTKNLLIVFFCFASVTSVLSQTFSILPSGTRTFSLACDSFAYHGDTIYISNPNSSDLDLSYTVTSNTLPNSTCWSYQLCDWDKCRFVIPTATIHPAKVVPANTQNSSMMLDIKTWNNKGQGSVTISIFETGNPSNSQTLTWTVSSGCSSGANCTSSIFETENNNSFIAYPNPAEDFINVEILSNHKPGGVVQVCNIVGEKLLEYLEIKNSVTKVDVSAFPAGTYFIKYHGEEGQSVKRFFKAK